jgi:phosphatidylglycerol:prolipoprotein diacylglycerol transferase
LYVVGYGLAWWLMPKLQKYRKLSLVSDEWVIVVAGCVAGVLIGGRLGYVFFYELVYFLSHGAQAFYVGMGGMSIHGGMIGVGVALGLVSKLLKINVWQLADVVVVPAGLGVALGRVGNLINQELFVSAGANLVAMGGSLVVALICFIYLVGVRGKSGYGAVIFLGLMGIFRFMVEYVRVHDYDFFLGLSRGQWLSVATVVAGLVLGWVRWVDGLKEDGVD